MLKGEMQLMFILMLAWVLLFFLVLAGILPPISMAIAPFVLLFGILGLEVILTLKWYSGKPFLQLNIRDRKEVLYRVFHMIDEIHPIKELGEEIAEKLGLQFLRNGYWYFAKFHRNGKKLWFLGYESPFPGVIFFTTTKIEELWDRDYVEPEHIAYKIPIFSIYINGLKVGEYQGEQIIHNSWWKRLLFRKPEFETRTLVYPIVLGLYHKGVELEHLKDIKEAWQGLPEFYTAISKNLKMWVMENGELKITDTEKTYLIKRLEELARSKKEIEKALIDEGVVAYTSPKFIHPAQFEGGRIERVPSWVIYLLVGLIGITVFFILVSLGVI